MKSNRIMSSSSPAAHPGSARPPRGCSPLKAHPSSSPTSIAPPARLSPPSWARRPLRAHRRHQRKDAQAAVDLALSAFGHLHGLVNCAGIAPSERIVGRDGPHRLDTFAKTININLVGAFNMIRLAAAAIAKESPAPTASAASSSIPLPSRPFDGQIGQAAYAASKGGVVALTLPIARELARFGIRVVTIAPGSSRRP
jgi:NAD(P)-dependent dehydrogenase (short-subunit alcohol dehydrogenase family)